MKRLLLLSLSLVATLGVGCSNPPPQDPPPAPMAVKKRTQALTGVTLREEPVSADVLAATEGEATVRVFRYEVAEGISPTVEELVTAALEEGGSDVVNLPWQAGPERDRDETRGALKYLNALVPAIEAQVGTGEQYRSGYRHWFQMTTADVCSHGDFYGLVFREAGRVVVIEATGNASC